VKFKNRYSNLLQAKKSETKPKRVAKSAEDKALTRALNFIKYRPRSAMEVVKKLQQLKYNANEINSVVEQLTKVKILDDTRFVKDWVRFRDRLSPRGEYLLHQELQEKGITKNTIENILEYRQTKKWSEEIGLQYNSKDSVDKRLAQTIVKKFSEKYEIKTDKDKNRLASKLARRGFSPNIVYDLVLSIRLK